MPKHILACVHRPNSSCGEIGRALLRRGEVVEKKFIFQQKIPAVAGAAAAAAGTGAATGATAAADAVLENCRAVILFGGPQSANDNSEEIKFEHRLAEQALRQNIPLLGICLGAQILARVIGGEVKPHEQQKVEAGFYPIQSTAAGEGLFPKNFSAYHWHREGIRRLPREAVLLATNNTFPVQAFQAQPDKPAFGLQFHPEIDWTMMMHWVRRDKKEEQRLRQRNARPAWVHPFAYLRHARKVQRWLDRFLNLWLNQK